MPNLSNKHFLDTSWAQSSCAAMMCGILDETIVEIFHKYTRDSLRYPAFLPVNIIVRRTKHTCLTRQTHEFDLTNIVV